MARKPPASPTVGQERVSSLDILAPLDQVANDLIATGLPDQVVAGWLLPIFAHLAAQSRGLDIPETLARLSRRVGTRLGGAPEE
jgi:hypothetical protein